MTGDNTLMGNMRRVALENPAEIGARYLVMAASEMDSMVQEISDLREKLRISEENRKLLAVEAFVKAGEEQGNG